MLSLCVFYLKEQVVVIFFTPSGVPLTFCSNSTGITHVGHWRGRLFKVSVSCSVLTSHLLVFHEYAFTAEAKQYSLLLKPTTIICCHENITTIEFYTLEKIDCVVSVSQQKHQ